MYPKLDGFLELSKHYKRVPVYLEIDGDLDTPITLLRNLLGKNNCLLLESANQKKIYSRFSFLAFDARKFVLNSDGLFDGLNEGIGFLKKFLIENQSASFDEFGNFSGGFIAALTFEFVNQCGILRKALDNVPKELGVFYFVDKFLVYDNYTNKLFLAKSQEAGNEESYCNAEEELLVLKNSLKESNDSNYENTIYLPKMTRSIPEKRFIDNVKFLRNQIEKGELIQVVLSDYIEIEGLNPFEFYRKLRRLNPSPYMYFIKDANKAIVGSSPEVHISVRKNIATIKPIAGTRPIGKTQAETKIFETELSLDEKENAEHLMLLDLARNDLSRVCKPKSVKVKSFKEVEYYSHVMHLVSEVQGEIKEEFDLLDVLTNTFPAGTVSGAPKVRAIELIKEVENTNRDFYAGCVGYIGLNGNMDMAITIRTAFFDENKAKLQAGAGIVFDSIPEKEFKEAMDKLGALLKAGGISDSINR